MRSSPTDAASLASIGYESEEVLRQDATEADIIAAGLKIGHVRRVLRALRTGALRTGPAPSVSLSPAPPAPDQ